MGTRRQGAIVAPARESKKLLTEEEDLRAVLDKTPVAEGPHVSLSAKKLLFKLIAEEQKIKNSTSVRNDAVWKRYFAMDEVD